MNKICSNRNKSYYKVLWLEYVTLVWNIIEGAVAIVVGTLSGSISLVAFGLESGIEVFSSAVTIWEIKCIDGSRKKMALKMISWAFLIVSMYVAVSASLSLIRKDHSEPGWWAVAYMALVSLVMFGLGYWKRKLGLMLNDSVIVAESKFTFLDVGLSSAILIGLLVNIFLDWWWIDQILALGIAGNAFFQGIRGLVDEEK